MEEMWIELRMYDMARFGNDTFLLRIVKIDLKQVLKRYALQRYVAVVGYIVTGETRYKVVVCFSIII